MPDLPSKRGFGRTGLIAVVVILLIAGALAWIVAHWAAWPEGREWSRAAASSTNRP